MTAKKKGTEVIRVKPEDHKDAQELILAWKKSRVGKISMGDVFRAGVAAIRKTLKGK